MARTKQTANGSTGSKWIRPEKRAAIRRHAALYPRDVARETGLEVV